MEEFRPALHKPDPAGFFLLLLLQGRMQARRENIGTSGSHLSATLRPGLTIELVNERPGRFYYRILQSAALTVTGMTQGTCDPCSLRYSASHSCRLSESRIFFFSFTSNATKARDENRVSNVAVQYVPMCDSCFPLLTFPPFCEVLL